MLERIYPALVENWLNLTATLVVAALIVIKVYFEKGRRLETREARAIASELDRFYGLTVVVGFAVPILQFVVRSRPPLTMLGVSDTLFLEAAVFLMLGAYYPIVFAVVQKPRLGNAQLLEAVEANANWWAFGAILLALSFAASGTFVLSDENTKRSARLFDVEIAAAQLQGKTGAHDEAIAKLTKLSSEQNEAISRLNLGAGSLSTTVRSLQEVIGKVSKDMAEAEQKQEKRITELATQVNEICKAVARLQRPVGRQKGSSLQCSQL